MEKLALVRIAFCKAPVLISASWRCTSVPSASPASFRVTKSFSFATIDRTPPSNLHSCGGATRSARPCRSAEQAGRANPGVENCNRLPANPHRDPLRCHLPEQPTTTRQRSEEDYRSLNSIARDPASVCALGHRPPRRTVVAPGNGPPANQASPHPSEAEARASTSDR